ncbi:MAG: hypothetical protein ACI4LH_05710 [Candidatus Heritagella sp.]
MQKQPDGKGRACRFPFLDAFLNYKRQGGQCQRNQKKMNPGFTKNSQRERRNSGNRKPVGKMGDKETFRVHQIAISDEVAIFA